MAEPYIAEIIMFGGNFAPRTWAYCDGQLIAVSTNEALFSLLGTTFGGDGRSTFGLPDMRGRAAVHAGTGAGLSPYRLGQKKGGENNTMTVQTMPSHTHPATGKVNVTDTTGNLATPVDNFVAPDVNAENDFSNAATAGAFMDAGSVTVDTVSNAGSNQPYNNVGPYLAVHYIIALYGIYPSRS